LAADQGFRAVQAQGSGGKRPGLDHSDKGFHGAKPIHLFIPIVA
jgi:hypothetical protein